MRYVVGIGNPGDEYRGTRHNIGFSIIEAVAKRLGLSLAPDKGPVLVARGGEGEESFVLLEPQSYVNRSGEAFEAFVDEPVAAEKVLVVLDDLALDAGVLRLRAKGSDGGHRGLRSLIGSLGTQSLPRLRVGVGRAPAEQWREFVLSPPVGDERMALDRAVLRSVDAVIGWLEAEPFDRLQSRINSTSPSGSTRGTGEAVSAASAAPHPLAAGRRRDVRDSFMEPKTVKYEGMFLLPAQGPTLDRGAVLGTVTTVLEKHSIKPIEIDVWDERKLAYPVKKNKRGVYVLAFFETDPEFLVPLNHDLNLMEDMLRHVFVRHDDEFPEFPRRKPRREEGARADKGEASKAAKGEAPKAAKGEAPKADEGEAPKADAGEAPKADEGEAPKADEGGEEPAASVADEKTDGSSDQKS